MTVKLAMWTGKALQTRVLSVIQEVRITRVAQAHTIIFGLGTHGWTERMTILTSGCVNLIKGLECGVSPAH